MLLLVPKSMFHKENRCLYSAFPSVYTVVAENQARGSHLCHDALWYVVCPSASGHALVAAFSVPDRGDFSPDCHCFFTRPGAVSHPTRSGVATRLRFSSQSTPISVRPCPLRVTACPWVQKRGFSIGSPSGY